MFNQKIFSIMQVIAQAIFSFVFLSTLIKSGNKIDYVDWSISVALVSATYSFNIFSGVLFNKFIASGDYDSSIIFLNVFGIIVISLFLLIYGQYVDEKIYFYLAIIFSSIMQISFSLCNIVDGLGKIIYRCAAQIIIFIFFTLLLFYAQKINFSMIYVIFLSTLTYLTISIINIIIITINKSWSLKLPRKNWSKLISQNSYAIGGSVAQSWIEPLIKYNLVLLGGPHLIVLFDVSTRVASTIRTFIASFNTPLIPLWSQSYSQAIFNKELIINLVFAMVLYIIYFFISSKIFLVFFGLEENNISFTVVIICTYFFMTMQNLPNIRNIVLNRLSRNFYAILIVLMVVGLGFFYISNVENYIWTYLIGTILSTIYLFFIKR